MSWTGCQNKPIYLNFHLQKSLKSFEKNSADKIWSNKNTRWKVPCPVPDRVKKYTKWSWRWRNIVGHLKDFLLLFLGIVQLPRTSPLTTAVGQMLSKTTRNWPLTASPDWLLRSAAGCLQRSLQIAPVMEFQAKVCEILATMAASGAQFFLPFQYCTLCI